MTLSGEWSKMNKKSKNEVLIPLLLDDPLWVATVYGTNSKDTSLNPSFAG